MQNQVEPETEPVDDLEKDEDSVDENVNTDCTEPPCTSDEELTTE